MTHLDAAAAAQAIGRDRAVFHLGMLFLLHRIKSRQSGNGGGVGRQQFVPRYVLDRRIVEQAAFAGIGEDVEFVAEVAADRPGRRPHRHRLKAQASEGAKISDEHRFVARLQPLFVEVEAVGILHQEFAPAHDSESWPDLVAELPLDMIKGARKVPVGLHRVTEQRGDHFLVGRSIEHLAAVTIGEPKHFRAISVEPARLAPQIGRLDRRHQHFDGARAVLFLAHDLLDLVENPEAEGQPGIDSRGGLANQPGAKHQLVADDLRVGGRFSRDRQEVMRKAHRLSNDPLPEERLL